MGSYLQPGDYYGAVEARREWNGVVMSEVHHIQPRSLPEHSHERAFTCLVLQGGYTERVGRRTTSFEPLSALFHPPGQSHQDEIGKTGGRFFSIELERALVDRVREVAPWPASMSEGHGGELVWLASRLYGEFRRADPWSPLVAEGLALEMLALAARCDSHEKAPVWMSRVIEILNEQRDASIPEIAASAGVHPVHLARVFRRVHRCTIGDYVMRLRVSEAGRLLSGSVLPLAEVALATGFSDQSHLTRVFKRATGMTPGAFRTRLQ